MAMTVSGVGGRGHCANPRKFFVDAHRGREGSRGRGTVDSHGNP